MAAKLAILLIIVAIVLSVAVIGAFYYLKHRAELKHEKEMTEAEMEHEERRYLFDE